VIGIDHKEDKDWMFSDTLGHIEDISFASVNLRAEEENGIVEQSSGNLTEEMNRLRGDAHSISLIRKAVEDSRKGFQTSLQRDFDTAIEESLRSLNEKEGDSQKVVEDEEAKALEISRQLYEKEQNEEEFLRLALQNSLGGESNNSVPQTNANDDAYQATLLTSMMEGINLHQNNNDLSQNPIVVQAVSLGIDQNEAIQALMRFGNDQDQVFNYLFGG